MIVENSFSRKLDYLNKFVYSLVINLQEAFKVIFIERKIYLANFIEHLRRIVWTCLPIAVLTVCASSIIFAIHVAPTFATRGLTSYLGGGIALALIRECVPVMGSLALVTQYCSGATAQIGSMKITEQLDAMRITKVSPVSYILVPMMLAGVIGFPIVIAISIISGVIVNFFATNFLIDITEKLYTSSISHVVELKDIFLALTKAAVFGFFVTLVSYTCGVLAHGGAKAVGNSTRLAVVINFALIIILDYIITALWL
jgi:phospholipid/cholesterol/gamma-HCH transport system permease protein